MAEGILVHPPSPLEGTLPGLCDREQSPTTPVMVQKNEHIDEEDSYSQRCLTDKLQNLGRRETNKLFIINIETHTVRPNGITDRETYFRINYAFCSRYRYRQKLFWIEFFVADAYTAVFLRFRGAAHSRKKLFRNYFISYPIQIQRNIILL